MDARRLRRLQSLSRGLGAAGMQSCCFVVTVNSRKTVEISRSSWARGRRGSAIIRFHLVRFNNPGDMQSASPGSLRPRFWCGCPALTLTLSVALARRRFWACRVTNFARATGIINALSAERPRRGEARREISKPESGARLRYKRIPIEIMKINDVKATSRLRN